MKRSVEPDFDFDKSRFGDLLKDAVGSRTISQFGKDADLSFSYLSKYMNKREDKTPTIQTIRKIASASEGPSFEELLQVAGYDPEKYSCDEGVDGSVWTLLKSVVPSLYQAPFDWKLYSPRNGADGLFKTSVEDAPFKDWYFIPVLKDSVSKEDVMELLGDTRIEVIGADSKVTFVTSKNRVYEQLTKIELPLISLRLSVALANNTSGTIDYERYMKTAVQLMDDDYHKMLLAQRERNVEIIAM